MSKASAVARLAETVVDVCKDDKTVQNILGSIDSGHGYSSKAELVCQCLNKELGAYGFSSYPSVDHTTVLVNDETMCKVLDFFNKKGYQPHIHATWTGKIDSQGSQC